MFFTVERDAGARQAGQSVFVGLKVCSTELVCAARREAYPEGGVLRRNNMHQPALRFGEHRMTFGGLGEADQHKRRIYRDRTHRCGGEPPPAAVCVRRCHDGGPAGEGGHRPHSSRSAVVESVCVTAPQVRQIDAPSESGSPGGRGCPD